MPTYTTFPTTVIGPTYPLEVAYEPKILKTDFGDGYTQEAPDGLNFLLGKYTVSWEALLPTERNTIKAFLEARGGYQTFLWTDPESVQHKVKCRSWTFSNVNPAVYSLRASFDEVPY